MYVIKSLLINNSLKLEMRSSWPQGRS